MFTKLSEKFPFIAFLLIFILFLIQRSSQKSENVDTLSSVPAVKASTSLRQPQLSTDTKHAKAPLQAKASTSKRKLLPASAAKVTYISINLSLKINITSNAA